VAAAATVLRAAAPPLQPGGSTPGAGDLLGQMYAIRAYQAVFRSDLPRAMELARQAFEYLPKDNIFARTIVAWLLGLTQYFDEGIAAATRAFTETLELSQVAGSTFITLLSIFSFGYLHLMQGQLRQAKEVFGRGLQLAGADGRQPETGEGERPALGTSLVYQGLGEVSREQNDLDSADRYLAQCIELGEQWGNAEMLADSYVFAARTRQAQGDVQAAHKLIHKAEQLTRENKLSPLTIRQVEAHRARLWVAQGNLETAARWAASLGYAQEAEGDSSGHILLFVREIEEATLARLLIAQREFDEAMSLLAPLLQAVEDAGWMGIAIELLALQALALQGQGQTAELRRWPSRRATPACFLTRVPRWRSCCGWRQRVALRRST
jgi:LuxR family maltose regulon positive regulatory protein